MSCAVCENRGISSTFTLFGKDVCPEGYVADYTGYGFASRHGSSYQKTNYFCLDSKPQEYSRRTGTNYNHGIVWPMEAACGTLPCPPYTQNREILCAQCSYQSSVCPHYVDGQDCVIDCGVSKYADSSKRCRLCDSECIGCNGTGPFQCTQCAHYKYSGQCVLDCPKGTIANSTNDCIVAKRKQREISCLLSWFLLLRSILQQTRTASACPMEIRRSTGAVSVVATGAAAHAKQSSLDGVDKRVRQVRRRSTMVTWERKYLITSKF